MESLRLKPHEDISVKNMTESTSNRSLLAAPIVRRAILDAFTKLIPAIRPATR